MKRISIAGVLFLSFILNIFYCIALAVIIIMQKDLMLARGVSEEVASVFTIPTLYIIFGIVTLLMQLVMVLSFSNSMRFAAPTIWIEAVGCIMFGGVFRVLYHYFPQWESGFSKFRGLNADASAKALVELISQADCLFYLASACFLVGAGMTICFKKFVRYFMKSGK